jgi:hypothetical protein
MAAVHFSFDLSQIDWTAIAALATLVLATATAWLALTTRRVARATRDEVAFQARPVLLPGLDGPPPGNLALRFAGGMLQATVRNAGRGPAMFVRAELDPDNTSPDVWNLGALAPGDQQDLLFSASDFNGAKQILLDYRDMVGRKFSTGIVLTVVYDQRGAIYQFYDVRHFQGVRITGHGDALPQPGLRHLPGQEA